MFCKWCGLESDTTDVCSWCRRPFTATSRESAPETPKPVTPTAQADDSSVRASAPPPVPSPRIDDPPQPQIGADRADASFGLDDDLSATPFASPLIPHVIPSTPPTRTLTPPADPPGPLPGSPPAVETREPAEAEIGRLQRSGPPESIPLRGSQTEESPAIGLRAQPAEPVREAAPPPISLRQPTTETRQETAPLPLRGAAPPPRTESAIPELDLPELDLKPLEDDQDEIVVSRNHRLDLTGAPGIPVQEPVHRRPPATYPNPQPAPLASPAAPPPQASLPGMAHGIPQATVRAPRAGGRTWYCRWCGMESEAGDRCTWCHRDLRNLPAAGSGKGPVLARGKRGTVRPAAPVPSRTRDRDGGKSAPAQTPRSASPPKAASTPAPVASVAGDGAAAAAAPALRQGVPRFGTFRAQKSKYYADQVLDPVSGRHYDADSGETTDKPVEMREDPAADERTDLLRQTGIYLAGLAFVIGIGALAVRVIPQWYLAVIAALNIAGGMAMPPLRVVPFGEDDSSDVAWAIPLILVLGPIVGGMAYGVIAIMRQDANPAVVGIFITYLLIRFPIQLAAGAGVGESLQSLVPFAPPAGGRWADHLALQWLPFAGMAGWYMASFMHRADE